MHIYPCVCIRVSGKERAGRARVRGVGLCVLRRSDDTDLCAVRADRHQAAQKQTAAGRQEAQRRVRSQHQRPDEGHPNAG